MERSRSPRRVERRADKFVQYYRCPRFTCVHLWRSFSKAACLDKKICQECNTVVQPLECLPRWDREHYIRTRTNWQDQLYLSLLYDPALFKHGIFDELPLADDNEITATIYDGLRSSEYGDKVVRRTNMSETTFDWCKQQLLSGRIEHSLTFSQEYVMLVVWHDSSNDRQTLSLLSAVVEWGSLVAGSGRHNAEKCEQCRFYRRSCKLCLGTSVGGPCLVVSHVGNDSEDDLRNLFGDRVLRRNAAVLDVVLGQKEDIDRYLASAVASRPQVANEIRAKHMALQISKKERYQNYLRSLVNPPEDVARIEEELANLELGAGLDDGPAIYRENKGLRKKFLLEQKADLLAKWEQRKARVALHMPSLNPRARLVEVDLELSQLEEKVARDGMVLPEIGPHENKRRPDLAAITFSSASVARDAVEEFSQLRRLQDEWEDERLKVGLLSKDWKNWYSVLFSQDVVIERTDVGPIAENLCRLGVLYFLGKVRKIEKSDARQETFLVKMISVPRLLRHAIEAVQTLANTLKHFRIVTIGKLHQVVDPKCVFDSGYMDKFEEEVIQEDTANSDSGGDVGAMDGIEYQAVNERAVEHVDALCGLLDAADLRVFLNSFYKPRAHARVTEEVALLGATTAISAASSRASLLNAPIIGGGRRCFLQGTLLKSCSGQFCLVEELQVGSRVASANASPLQVIEWVPHLDQENLLVSLRTDNEHVVVTGSHRVVTSLTPFQATFAERLSIGQDVVISGGFLRQLIDVRQERRMCNVYEVLFNPDEPVETFPLQASALLTMGQRRRSPVRRSRMNQRLAARQNFLADNEDIQTFDPFR